MRVAYSKWWRNVSGGARVSGDAAYSLWWLKGNVAQNKWWRRISGGAKVSGGANVFSPEGKGDGTLGWICSVLAGCLVTACA
jgi:hypothetical protein